MILLMTLLLIILPLAAGIISFFIKSDSLRRGILIFTSLTSLFLTFAIDRGNNFFSFESPWNKAGTFFSFSDNWQLNKWIALDDLSTLFMYITSILFAGASIYCAQYLADEKTIEKTVEKTDRKPKNREALFTGSFLIFFSTMALVITSRHIAMIWVAIEATTLASAPLLYFHKTRSSLEATWKYLLICSVGIAIALLGIFFLNLAVNNPKDMFITSIIKNAGQIHIPWLKGAFILIFAGFGTKMGLAPFHTWLPDAHSQAPSAVSALLSGALLNCAFLGILRVYQICSAAGLKLFCQEIFIFFGILSILTATVFILNQKNYKRMLAYSSIEHMGIILLGTGLGSWAVYGAFINMTAHSFTKAGLFLTSGNILSWFKTNKISRVTGILEKMPDATGILWLLGFLLITGTPPSGIFTGKFLILKQALFTGNNLTALLFLSGLALIFIGMARSFIFMAMGNKNDGSLENLKNNLISDSKDDLKDNSEDDLINRHNKKTGFTRIVIPLLFFLSALGLGLFMPDSVNLVITAACRAAGGCE